MADSPAEVPHSGTQADLPTVVPRSGTQVGVQHDALKNRSGVMDGRRPGRVGLLQLEWDDHSWSPIL